MTQWNERLVSSQVVGRWSRLYSEVQLIELRTVGATHRLISKRAVRHAANEAYHQRGNVACHEFKALSEAHEVLKHVPQCAVPRVYGVVPGEELLLMEYVAGADLDRQVAGARLFMPADRQAVAERHFERLGIWLRHYQRGTAVEINADASEQLLYECQRRLAGLGQLSPSISAEWIALVDRNLELIQRQINKPVAGSSCHGDFGPWNVLVTPDRLTVLDFFCQRVDSIWIDPLNIVSYLQSQQSSVTFSRRRVYRLRDAFLLGYGRQLAMDEPDVRLSWAFQQICRLQDALRADGLTWTERYRRRKTVNQITRELAQ
jgi:hypothetical protein